LFDLFIAALALGMSAKSVVPTEEDEAEIAEHVGY
jgi:hypothetical protein